MVIHYYLGSKLIAVKKNAELSYIMQDHLGSTSAIANSSGTSTATITYHSFGEPRFSSGTLPTDKKYTGQRLDTTGLYYYNARYYDPQLGRFISPDTFTQWSTGFNVVSTPLTVNIIPIGLGSRSSPQVNYPSLTPQAPVNPQNLNRYSYVLNNPLIYTDSSGWWTFFIGINISIGFGGGVNVSYGIAVDGNGNLATVTSAGGGAVGGASLAGGLQAQCTNADSVGQLSGLSVQTGGSGTLAIGPSIGAEAVVGLEGEKYTGGNVNFGVGVGTPEGHIMFEQSDVEVKGNVLSFIGEARQAFYPNSVQYYSVATPLAVPDYIGNGLYNWGTDAYGATIISSRDPSTYIISDWDGY